MKRFPHGRPISALFVSIALAASACTVQLTAPYSKDIDKDVTALQNDFLRFAANMQMQAGKPEAYYSNHQKDYADFEARLAAMKMRSESLPAGVSCGRVLDAGKRAERALSGPMQSQVSDRMSQRGWGNVSCLPIRLTHTPTTTRRMLPVAGIKLGVGRCLHLPRNSEQRAEGIERVEAPVEAKRKFVEVGL